MSFISLNYDVHFFGSSLVNGIFEIEIWASNTSWFIIYNLYNCIYGFFRGMILTNTWHYVIIYINIMKTQTKLSRSYKTKIILAHSFIDWFWWKFVLMLISWRHNFFIKLYIYDLKCNFILWRSFVITTLTYVLMDNLCPSLV